MNYAQIDRCKYLLPCGICDKNNKPCSYNEPIVAYKCKHEFVFEKSIGDEEYSTTTYRCWKCGSVKIDKVTYG